MVLLETVGAVVVPVLTVAEAVALDFPHSGHPPQLAVQVHFFVHGCLMRVVHQLRHFLLVAVVVVVLVVVVAVGT